MADGGFVIKWGRSDFLPLSRPASSGAREAAHRETDSRSP